jgi:beta-glucosidase
MYNRAHMKHYSKLLHLLSAISLLAHITLLPTTYWNWQSINIHTIQFPAQFMWGVTSLAHEVEGYSKTSTWYAWENQLKANGQPFAQTRSGISARHSHYYKEDVQLIKNMGLTTYCFSIDWSRVEPEEGYFNEDALAYYINLCDELIANNITPIVVLKDLCDPLWFGYLGGFEYEKNIQFFEHYCLKVYETLCEKVDRWITFWAPDGYAMTGYLAGMIPPGVTNAHRAATVLKNELEAHVRVYKTLKAMPGSDKTKIGIIKHVHMLEPWHIWDYASCYVANKLTSNSFYSFFTTGTFSIKIPLPGRAGAWVTHTNAYAPKSLDFIGINYYSHGYIKNLLNHINNPSEIPTDVAGMTIYPEGLYLAIKEVADAIATKLNIPMIITQNGIATTDESIRDLYLKRHIYALSKALKDGYNVEGYCYYSLLDSFSWGSFEKKFGLFAVDQTTLDRTQKAGSKYYRDIVERHSSLQKSRS